jgi:hypothetical protein
MAGGGFDFSEFRELAESVKKLEKDSKKFMEDFLLQMALRALRNIKKRTPKDTGDLIGAWYLSGVARRGNDVMINIINPKLYASFVEYGHWQQVGRFIPGHWEGEGDDARFVYEPYAKGQNGGDDELHGMFLKNPWVDGKFMLTISIQEIERKIPKRLEAAWAKYAAGILGK